MSEREPCRSCRAGASYVTGSTCEKCGACQKCGFLAGSRGTQCMACYSGDIVLENSDTEGPPPPVLSAAFNHYAANGGTDQPQAAPDLGQLAILAAEILSTG